MKTYFCSMGGGLCWA